MSSDALISMQTTAKPGFAFYGLLLSFSLGLTLLLSSYYLNYSIPRYWGFLLWGLFLASHISLLIELSFEAFRRYSRFGISHTKTILNHMLSIALVILPFASIIFSILVLPALILMAVSKYRSPDFPQAGQPFYKKDGIFELANAVLWLLTNYCFFMNTGHVI